MDGFLSVLILFLSFHFFKNLGYSKSISTSYCPISYLNTFSKILEHLLSVYTQSHITSSTFKTPIHLVPSQSHCKGSTTENQIISFTLLTLTNYPSFLLSTQDMPFAYDTF